MFFHLRVRASGPARRAPCGGRGAAPAIPRRAAIADASALARAQAAVRQAAGPCTGPELRGELLALCDAMVMGGAGAGTGADAGSGLSDITASVVNNNPAMLAAF